MGEEESGETSGGNSTDKDEGIEVLNKDKGDIMLPRSKQARSSNTRKRGYIDYLDDEDVA